MRLLAFFLAPLLAPAALIQSSPVDPVCAEVTALPEPSGPSQIGTITYRWADTSRVETATPNPDDLRQVTAQLFYPAVRQSDGPPVAYMPDLATIRDGFRADRREFPQQLAEHFAVYGCVLPHALPGVPVDGLRSEYPVVVFSPGGNMSRHWHTALAEELASHGYIVAVLSHAHSGLDVFAAGGFLMSSPYWDARDESEAVQATRAQELSDVLAADARFALDRLTALDADDPDGLLTGRLDLDRIALAGHSRGGKTVVRGCLQDDRFGACVVFDNLAPEPERSEGLHQPLLVMRRAWGSESVEALHGFLQASELAYDVVLRDAGHMSFSDLPLVDSTRGTDIDPDEAHRTVSDVALSFLASVFEGQPSPLDADVLPENLEVTAFTPTPAAVAQSVPSSTWAAPDRSRCDASALDAAHGYADSLDAAATVLILDGQIVDTYGDVTNRYRLHSVRKSLLSALWGIAVDEGRADTSHTLADLGIEDHAGLSHAERGATVRQLLQSRSGVFLPATHENVAFDRVRPERGSHAPGAHWFYSNWDFNAAGTAYGIATSESAVKALAARIAGPLGMEDYRPEDGSWRYSSRSWHPAYVYRMSARDLARFGLLILRDGRWGKRQVVSESWVRESTRWHSQATRPDGAAMPGVGYGLMWWTEKPARADFRDVGLDLGPGVAVASGTGPQELIVAPARDLVFVYRTDTDTPRGHPTNSVHVRRLLKRLLGACE